MLAPHVSVRVCIFRIDKRILCLYIQIYFGTIACVEIGSPLAGDTSAHTAYS